MKNIIIILYAILLSGIPAWSQEAVRKSVEIDIYNDDIGVVKEKRIVNLKKGISEIIIDSLPLDLNFELLAINIDAKVLEQKYDDNYNSASIIGQFKAGDTMTYKDWKTVYTEIFLSFDGYNCLFLDSNNSIHRISGVPEIILKNNHEFGNKLFIKVDANKSGEQEFEIIYKSNNFRYFFEYTGILADAGTKMDLKSQILIRNYSNIDYMNAKVKIMKGEYYSLTGLKSLCSDFAYIPPPATYSTSNHKELFDYHIINIEKPVNFVRDIIAYIDYFHKENVELYTDYYSYINIPKLNGDDNKVSRRLFIPNNKTNGLGYDCFRGGFFLQNRGKGKNIDTTSFYHTIVNDTIGIYHLHNSDINCRVISDETVKVSDTLEERNVLIKIDNDQNEFVDFVFTYSGIWNLSGLSSNVKFEKKYYSKNDYLVEFYVKVPPNSHKKVSIKQTKQNRGSK